MKALGMFVGLKMTDQNFVNAFGGLFVNEVILRMYQGILKHGRRVSYSHYYTYLEISHDQRGPDNRGYTVVDDRGLCFFVIVTLR